MNRTTLLLVCCLAASVEAWPARPQDRENRVAIDELRDEFTRVVRDLRGILFKSLRGSEATVEREIDYRIVSDGNDDTIARAYYRNGIRTVDMSVGFIRALDLQAAAATIEGQGERDLVRRYIDYAVHAQRENWDRGLSHQQPQYIKSPYEFANWSATRIDRFYDDEASMKKKSGIFSVALAFALAHEVAHHVLLHRFDAPLEQKRRDEKAADLWATKCLLAVHMMPMPAALPLYFFYVKDRDAIAHEQERNHPADIRRIEAVFEATINVLPQFQNEIRRAGSTVSTLTSLMRATLDSLREDIALEEAEARQSLPAVGEHPVEQFTLDRERLVQACLEKKISSCLKDCTKNYGFSRSRCRDDLCNPNSGSNQTWTSACRQRVGR